MYNKEKVESALKQAGLYFCNIAEVWCGVKYDKFDYQCNCQWVKIMDKFKENK